MMLPGLSARKLSEKLPYLVFRNEPIERVNVCQIATEQKTRVHRSNTFQKTPLDKDEGIFGLGIKITRCNLQTVLVKFQGSEVN